MTRRPRRVIPAVLLALVILAVCVLAAVSIIQALAGQAPVIPLAALGRHVRALRLDGAVMVTAGAVAAGLGLILVGCALLPGRAKTLALAPAGEGAAPNAGVSRAGLRRALTATVADIDGVTAARVRVRVRRVTARVRTELDRPQALRAAVSGVLEQRLTQTGLARPPEVRVSVRRVDRRAAA